VTGFRSFAELIDAEDAGQRTLYGWRKAPTQTTASGIWFDLSMSPGNPVPNFYAAAPLVGKVLAQSTDGGFFHGSMSSLTTVTFGSSSASGLLMTTPSDYPSLTKLRFTTTATLPTGLAINTDYWTIRVSSTTSRLCTSEANANAGKFILFDPLTPANFGSGTQKAMELPNSVKSLRRIMAMTVTTTAVPLPCILLDYLLYYPFVDMSVTDAQSMIVGDALPRYPTGAGVQIMAVEVASQIGGVSFNVSYTNSDGVAGRTSGTVTCNTQTVNGTIISTAPATVGCAGPFIPLQADDSGVRSIESCTFITGDVGLITLVLVKPLASFSIFDITAPSERDMILDGVQLPVIKDDAYLNLICYPSGTLAGAQIIGTIETVWN
jgi:hypothetical protein